MKRRSVKILLTACLAITVSAAAAACGTAGSAENAKGDFPTDQTKSVGSGRMLTLKGGEPDVSLGEEGDICLVAETGILYRKSAKGWQEAEFESYGVAGNSFTVTYKNGSVGTYDMASSVGECTHETLGEPYTVYPAKCVIPGIAVRYCSDCNASFPVVLPATGEHEYAEGSYTCLYCGEANYFKDAQLDSSGRYVIKDMREVPFGGEGELVIPGEIDGHKVVIGKQAFGNSSDGGNTTLKSVVIGEGVEEIEGYAFQGCTELESVVLPESLTVLGADPDNGTLYTNYNSIFEDCSSLKSVTFKGDVTVIGNRTFYDCSSLSSIDLPDSLKEIGSYAFQNSGLSSVAIPADLKLGLDVFRGCSALTSVEFKGETVYGTVGSNPKKECAAISNGCFKECTNLAHVTLPEDIEEIGSSAFELCSSLAEIEIPANVTAIGEKAFQNCESIASLTFGEGSKLKSIGSSAFYCGGTKKPANERLQTVILPESLETIGKTAFGYCTALESIVLPSTLTSLGSDKFDEYFGPFYKTKLANVFYSGTQSDWESKVTNYDKLQFGDKLVYFSAEPQTGCWHWDGGVPKIWE